MILKKKDKKSTTAPKAKAASKEKKPQPTNTYYVTVRYDGKNKDGWEIKRGNASKVSAVTKTKEEAIAKVKVLAKNSDATVIIYKQDGVIDETLKLGSKK